MNSQVIRIAENGHEFFLQYPQSVAELAISIAGKDIAETFHAAHAAIQKEQHEHISASDDKKDTKADIRRLEKSLRTIAYAMERGVNAVLDLTGRPDEEVDFVSGVDFVLSMEDFIASLSKVSDIIEVNPAYKASYETLTGEFDQYKAAAGSIGQAKITADTERQQYIDTVDGYAAIISSLHALIGRYLAKKDRELLHEYRKGLRHKKKMETKTASDAVAN